MEPPVLLRGQGGRPSRSTLSLPGFYGLWTWMSRQSERAGGHRCVEALLHYAPSLSPYNTEQELVRRIIQDLPAA